MSGCEGCVEQSMFYGPELPYPLLAATLPAPPSVPQPGSSVNRIIQSLYGGFIPQARQVEASAADPLTQSPALLPSPEVRGCDWQFQPSDHRLGPTGSQPSQVLSQSDVSNVTKDIFITLFTQEFPKVWGALCPQSGMKIKCIFFYISLYHHSVHRFQKY